MCSVRFRRGSHEIVDKSPEEKTGIALLFGHPLFRRSIWFLFLIMSAIMVGHNVVLRTWGLGTFPSIARFLESMAEDGALDGSPLVDADGRAILLRYADVPVGRFLHILPAGLWSIIAPLQLSPKFRSRYPTVHRRLGRLFIAMSVSMSIGLVPLAFMQGANEQAFTSWQLIVVAGSYFFITAVLGVHYARKKRFAEHRSWILRHVAIGYASHLQRLLGQLTWWIYPLIVPGYVDHTKEGAAKRALVFEGTFVVAIAICTVSMELWLLYVPRSSPPKDPNYGSIDMKETLKKRPSSSTT